MWSSKASEEKVNSLRLFTESTLPDSRLRASLIRHGGDINAAASELLLQAQSGNHNKPPTPRPREKPSTADDSKLVKTHRSYNNLRREAWEMFYMDNRTLARRTVGADQKAIDAFITSQWQEVGSAKRQEYTKRAAAENRAPEKSIQHPVQEQLSHPKPAPRGSEEQGSSEVQDQGDIKKSSSSVTMEKTAPISEHPHETDDRGEESLQGQGKTSTVQPALSDSSSSKTGPLSDDWPRQLASRLCSGSMLTRGKKLLNRGDELLLNAPVKKAKQAFRGKGRNDPFVEPTRIVRFYKNGRELGRLAPDISAALAPALQTKYVSATAKVISAPEVCKLFSEVLMEVSIFVSKDTFQHPSDFKEVEAGLSNPRSDGEADNGDKGIDTERINVVHMITALGICEMPKDGGDLESNLPYSTSGEPGSISEKEADAYCRTIDAIDLKHAQGFTASNFMSSSLREYQKAGVVWMLSREKHGSLVHQSDPNSVDLVLNPLWKKRIFPDKATFFINPTTGQITMEPPVSFKGGPYGGILADEMGLGKTVQCIACIVHDLEEQQSMGTCRKDTQANICNRRDTYSPERLLDHHEIDDSTQCKKSTALHSEPSTDNTMAGPKNIQKGLGRRQRISGKPDSELDEAVPKRPRRSTSRQSIVSPARNSPGSIQRKIDGESSDEDDVFDRGLSSTDNRASSRKPDGQRTSPKKKTSALKVLMSSASSARTDRGGTLVVCPLSLVTQWVSEVNHHVVPNYLQVVEHYGPNRGNAYSISLKSADVVVTTYGVLSSEIAKEDGNVKSGGQKRGPLFQLNWRRVILDEAHVIKSRTTQWAKACYQIRAEKRWCVTGTVIHNHVNDVFSLLHFLGVHPWSSWAFWNKGIVSHLESKDSSSQKAAMAMVRDIISSVTLRRKKSTKDSEGNPIIQLPDKMVDIVSIVPTPEEQDFYSSLHEQSKLQFDTFVAQGKVLSNYATVLELLLRLRQACDHPYLVIGAAPSKDSALLKNRSGLIKRFLDAGSSQQFVETVFKEAESGSLETSRECPLCLDIIDDPVAPKECGHPACRGCLTQAVRRTQKCPVCRVEIQLSSIYTLPRQTRFAIDLKKRWRSSAKIDKLLEEVRTRDSERKKDGKIGKTVVFSQFTSMLDLVGMALDREKFKTLRIDGSVPQKQRANILEMFENEDELEPDCANVLLVSLRAGGVGLNLVSASHAILLDIHWNPQVDAQAQDRVHRHGQTRDVLIRRYIVKDSVEEKLLQVQARKQDLADGALGMPTDDDRKQARLSELKLLFSAS